MIQLAQHFRRDPTSRHSEWLRQQQWFIKAREQQDKREEAKEQAEEALLTMAADLAVATEAQIARFEARMDAYEARLDDYDERLAVLDEAVARALIDQIARLETLEAERQVMLSRAFVIEDGRRVFRSSDGSYAIDEHGEHLDHEDVVNFGIPKTRDSAEDYQSKITDIEKTKLAIETLYETQDKITAAQNKSAKARELLNNGRSLKDKDGLTVGEIDEFEAELDAAMPTTLPTIPTSAMKFITGVDVSNAPDMSRAFSRYSVSTKGLSALQPVFSPEPN